MVEYKKIYKKRDGRVLIANGPREAQKRQQGITQTSTDELENLKEEIHMLRANLDNVPRTSDDMATKIDEVIEEVSFELEQRYIDRISTLESTLEDREKYIIKLEGRIEKQDNLIQKLTNNIGTIPAQVGTAPVPVEEYPARPNIDTIFIDPTTKGAEDRLESYVKAREVKSEKPNMSANLNKLKDLMGSKLLN